MRSQHIPMSFEELERLPHPPGWKYEYFEGCAHITPNHQSVVTTVTVSPRPVGARCTLRGLVGEDEAALLPVYLDAFADNQAFCDYSDRENIDAARADLRESFQGAGLRCWPPHAWP